MSRDRLFEKIYQWFESSHAVGISVVVNGNKGQNVAISFGTSAVDTKDPFGANTLVPIGSVTKILTALLFLKLRKMNAINFDGRVYEYLKTSFPELDQSFQNITILDLLTHTSGLPRDLKGHYFEESQFPDRSALLKTCIEQKVIPSARHLYRYSNLGYAILGVIAEEVLQMPYAQALDELILRPFDCESLTITPPTSSLKVAGYYYDRHSSVKIPQTTYDLGVYFATGGVWASSDGLTNLCNLLLGDTQMLSRVGLDDDDLARMFSFYFISESWESASAISWRGIKINGEPVFTHSGSVPGFSTCVLISPTTQRSIVITSNTESFLYPLAESLWPLMDGPPAETQSTDPKVDVAQYIGEYYWLHPSRRIQLTVGNSGELVAPGFSYRPLIEDLKLHFVRPDHFQIRGGLHDREYGSFERGQVGQIVGMWLGGTYFAKYGQA